LTVIHDAPPRLPRKDDAVTTPGRIASVKRIAVICLDPSVVFFRVSITVSRSESRPTPTTTDDIDDPQADRLAELEAVVKLGRLVLK
jgi:hypothetical protein